MNPIGCKNNPEPPPPGGAEDPKGMKSAAIDGSLEKWLSAQLAARAAEFAGKNLLLDVGGYHGDFAAEFIGLKEGPFSRAILFEPNPENFSHLKNRFQARPEIQTEQAACDVSAGKKTFFCQGETYTGSLLPYDRRPDSRPVAEFSVDVIVLDDFLAARQVRSQVGLIKIDTQGNDLRVLQGASATLRESRPWLVVELMFAPHYVGQCAPLDLALWLREAGYFLAAQFNEFYSADGWLAWADACFVPDECRGPRQKDFYPRPIAPEAPPRKNFWRRLTG